MPSLQLPVFATNRPHQGETVAQEINTLFRIFRERFRLPSELSIATAYINPAGFDLIADEVEKAPSVRLVLGAEPQWNAGAILSRFEARQALETEIVRDRDLAGFTREADRSTRRMVAWLRGANGVPSGGVKVRRLRNGFLHGKAFIASEGVISGVLAGSSNLTRAGLSVNRELNLGYPTSEHAQRVIDWFEEVWADAEPFDLAAFYEARWQPHAPWIIFLRMLHELYGDDPDDDVTRQLGLRLTGFQRDGVVRALRLLESLGGVLVCDEVGLGKTWIAGEIIHQASARDRQDVLVVCPASLRDSTWTPFLNAHDFSRRVKVVSYEELRIGEHPDLEDAGNRYALVVIDEAHNLRNRETARAEAVNQLLGGAYRKKVVLLTATPVNNGLDDLQALIGYFVRNDSHFADIGIPSIADYIKRAKRMDPETLSPEHLFDLMDQVAVRRTRRFILKNYPNDSVRGPDGQEHPIEFPTPRLHRVDYTPSREGLLVLKAVEYALDDPNGGSGSTMSLRDRLKARCADPKRLSMARYMPSLYATDAKLQLRQVVSSGLLESALLKRLESSHIALANTLGKMIISHEAFLKALAGGYVLSGEALTDFADSDDDLADFMEEWNGTSDDNCLPASGFDRKGLGIRVAQDVEVLRHLEMLSRKAAHAQDPKVERLVEILTDRAREAKRPSAHGISASDRRKTVVFSSYADTANHLHHEVCKAVDEAPKGSPLAAYRGRIAHPITGGRSSAHMDLRTRTLAEFAPATAGATGADGQPMYADNLDLLFATDVLAEGVNLQQAGHIVSVDLPWNPMRLVQRHGRCDRLFSRHREVDLQCFFPGDQLDELLELEATLQRKVAYANAAIGVGEVIPGQVADPTIEVLLRDQIEAVRKIHAGDDSLLVERGGSAALSGEEYRRRLERAMDGPATRSAVASLPFGAGSGFVARAGSHPGWVFCVKIGTHSKPWFRWVGAELPSWRPLELAQGRPWVIDDTLSCLMAADPGIEATEQVLPPAASENVYDAWAIAQRHVHQTWTAMTDPANLQPDVPLALREAAELVRDHGAGLGPEQAVMLRKLNGRWPKRIVDAVREAVRKDASPTARLKALVATVNNLGLDEPTPPKPLDPVELDQVRLVCWMAVVPA